MVAPPRARNMCGDNAQRRSARRHRRDPALAIPSRAHATQLTNGAIRTSTSSPRQDLICTNEARTSGLNYQYEWPGSSPPVIITRNLTLLRGPDNQEMRHSGLSWFPGWWNNVGPTADLSRTNCYPSGDSPRDDETSVRPPACNRIGPRPSETLISQAAPRGSQPAPRHARFFRFFFSEFVVECARPAPAKGAYRDRHDTRGGMRWPRSCCSVL